MHRQCTGLARRNARPIECACSPANHTQFEVVCVWGSLAPGLPLCSNSGCGVGFATSVDKASSFPACGAVPGARKIITGFRQQLARCVRPQSFGHHRVSVLCQTPACRSSRDFSRATNAVLPNRKSKGSKYFILTKTKKRQIRICPVLLWDSLAKWNHGPRCRCRDQRASELRQN
jgi:hypothetical protein